MKRFSNVIMAQAPTAEPDPMTVEGTRALVERFYALRQAAEPPQVAVGGARGEGSLSPLALLGRKNQKGIMTYGESRI